MSNVPLVTVTNHYKFGRGHLYLAVLDANNRPMGERHMGNCPGFACSVTTQRFKHTSSMSGQAITDLDIPISTELGAKITVEDMSAENYAIFLAGAASTVDQSSGSVTNERIYNVEANREYQLGTSTSNITGVRGVSAVTVKLYELLNAVARVNSTPYVVGDIFKSSTNVFLVTAAGTTAGSAPSYTTTAIGDSTADGTATVKFLGTTGAFVADTDYKLDATLARIGVISGSNLALAGALYNTVTDGYLSFSVDYTKAANSRTQITAGGGGSTTAQLRFVADNPSGGGDNQDLFIAKATLSPSGDNPFITGNAIASFTIDVGVNERDSNTPQVIIDGRAA